MNTQMHICTHTQQLFLMSGIPWPSFLNDHVAFSGSQAMLKVQSCSHGACCSRCCPYSLCMRFVQLGDFVCYSLCVSQPCHLPSPLQELLQELKHLKIKVEELENERNQYEWELKATKVKGSMRYPRRGFIHSQGSLQHKVWKCSPAPHSGAQMAAGRRVESFLLRACALKCELPWRPSHRFFHDSVLGSLAGLVEKVSR